MKSIVWFRQDLRVTDNPALFEAVSQGHVLPVYILDDTTPDFYKAGAASHVWLYHALHDLDQALDGQLCILKGDPEQILQDLVNRYAIQAIYWNRCYEPWQIARDTKIKTTLKESGVAVHSTNGSLLWEPWQILKSDKTPYKVFTPYFRRGCMEAVPPRAVLPEPGNIQYIRAAADYVVKLEHLLPDIRWDKNVTSHWDISEKGALDRLTEFLDAGLDGYKTGRDYPSQDKTSRLSPYLHFGQISPHQVWHAARLHRENGDSDHFCSELGWREFSYYLLYHFPDLPTQNFQSKFDKFSWDNHPDLLEQWQKGMTGYPLIDAGMRELWQTGYMHNRVRMVVASFLIKNLLIDWRQGQAWFWDCLFDADMANNSASWQWVAGSGADAAPYFRIFNPVTQSEKFDPDGAYIRQYVPELTNLPAKYIHKPWLAPDTVLKQAHVTLGETYPRPLVDVNITRKIALERYRIL